VPLKWIKVFAFFFKKKRFLAFASMQAVLFCKKEPKNFNSAAAHSIARALDKSSCQIPRDLANIMPGKSVRQTMLFLEAARSLS
jgi:hypothetical protein